MNEQKLKKTADFFVMSGQSNMQGQSESFVDFSAPEGVCAEYKFLSDRYEPVRHPSGETVMNEDGSDALLLGAHLGRSSVVPYFADEYYRLTGRTAAYAHVAKGATTVAEWLRGTERYGAAVKKISAAVSAAERDGIRFENKCFVWLQGESDGIGQTTKEEYKQRLLRLWSDLKADCGLEKFLMIKVGPFFDFPVAPIMEAQEELCAENGDFSMISRAVEGFSEANGLFQRAADQAGFHYTNRGYELVGRDAAKGAADALSR